MNAYLLLQIAAGAGAASVLRNPLQACVPLPPLLNCQPAGVNCTCLGDGLCVPGEEVLGPCFLTFPQSQTVEEGSPATFEVKVKSETPVRDDSIRTLEWCKVNHLLEESGRFRFREMGNDVFRLEIPNLSLTDSGLFRITAKNILGESSGMLAVDVKVELD